MRSELGQFRKDERGIAAVEFALILPVLITILFASIEYSYYFVIRSKITTSVHQIADVLSREYDNEVDLSDITDALSVVDANAPRISSKFVQSVAIVMIDFEVDPACVDPYDADEGCVSVPVVKWNYNSGFSDADLCELSGIENNERLLPGSLNSGYHLNVPVVGVFVTYEYQSIIAPVTGLSADLYASRILATRDGQPLTSTGTGFEQC